MLNNLVARSASVPVSFTSTMLTNRMLVRAPELGLVAPDKVGSKFSSIIAPMPVTGRYLEGI